MSASLTGEAAQPSGVVSGLGDSVPRIEKFHLAGTVVSRHDSHADFAAYVRSVALTSSLPQSGADMSRRVCRQLIYCLAEPLYEQDALVMRKVSLTMIE